MIAGDATLLTQVYQNLLNNALKFTDGAQPHICLTAEPAGNSWVLGVRDNGIGIEPQFAQRIFAPFQRLHTRSEYEGTGIGLAICKKVVERHGGRIWVESTPGAGAHFKFLLPAHANRRCSPSAESVLDQPAIGQLEHPSAQELPTDVAAHLHPIERHPNPERNEHGQSRASLTC